MLQRARPTVEGFGGLESWSRTAERCRDVKAPKRCKLRKKALVKAAEMSQLLDTRCSLRYGWRDSTRPTSLRVILQTMSIPTVAWTSSLDARHQKCSLTKSRLWLAPHDVARHRRSLASCREGAKNKNDKGIRKYKRKEKNLGDARHLFRL
jgi:hypothetical protein